MLQKKEADRNGCLLASGRVRWSGGEKEVGGRGTGKSRPGMKEPLAQFAEEPRSS